MNQREKVNFVIKAKRNTSRLSTMSKTLTCQRRFFSITGHYLNCAYMGPLSSKVVEAGIRGMQRKQDPAKIRTDDFFTGADRLREEFSCLLTGGKGERGRISIIPSVSYGMATVASNLGIRRGSKVLIAGEQFPSNVYPWQAAGAKVVEISAPDAREHRGKRWNEKILEAIKPGITMVAIGHVHWADGTRFDLEAIRKETERVGAYLVVDGTQSVGALPFDLKKIRPDALVCAGYKWLMGPYSIGLAWYGEAFNNGKPIEHNWITREGSENFTSLTNYAGGYQPDMSRFDVGERSNFILVPMMTEALRMLNGWKPERVQAYCGKISTRAITRLKAGGWWVEDQEFRGNHLFGLRPPTGRQASEWKDNLTQSGISVSFRGDAIRVAPQAYNTAEDLELLAEVLTNMK